MIDKSIEITKDFKSLLYYDGPILYTGFNDSGQRILASWCDIDEDRKIETHLCIYITEDEYDSFIHKNVSYRQLINAAKDIYLVTKNLGFQTLSTTKIKIEDIPKESLPTYESYIDINDLYEY